MGQFESNSAGGKVAEKVQKEVKEAGGIAKITTKYTTQQKETKNHSELAVGERPCAVQRQLCHKEGQGISKDAQLPLRVYDGR